MKKLIIITVLMAMSMSIRAQYRNVFVELGYDKAQVESKLHQVFNDVFRGPNKVYFEVDDSMGYVSDVKNHIRPPVALEQEVHAAPERQSRGLFRMEL